MITGNNISYSLRIHLEYNTIKTQFQILWEFQLILHTSSKLGSPPITEGSNYRRTIKLYAYIRIRMYIYIFGWVWSNYRRAVKCIRTSVVMYIHIFSYECGWSDDSSDNSTLQLQEEISDPTPYTATHDKFSQINLSEYIYKLGFVI